MTWAKLVTTICFPQLFVSIEEINMFSPRSQYWELEKSSPQFFKYLVRYITGNGRCYFSRSFIYEKTNIKHLIYYLVNVCGLLSCRTAGLWKLKNAQEFQTFALQTVYNVSYKQLNAKTTAKTFSWARKANKIGLFQPTTLTILLCYQLIHHNSRKKVKAKFSCTVVHKTAFCLVRHIFWLFQSCNLWHFMQTY